MREVPADVEEEAQDPVGPWWVRARSAWRSLSRARRRAAAALTVLCLGGTALVVWLGLSLTRDRLSWRDVVFQVVDARSVVSTFEVTKPPESSARCVLEAQEVGHAVVGRTTVVVPPAPTGSVVHRVTIRTTSPAVIGTVRRCTRV